MSEVAVAQAAAWLDDLLDAPKFRMEEPENGLIVDAGRPVRRIGAAVNTSFAAITAAAAGVDLLLVHHTSWPYIDLALHEAKLAQLKQDGVSLYCAHASLDGAPDVGTGDSLARLIGVTVLGALPSTRRHLPACSAHLSAHWTIWSRPSPASWEAGRRCTAIGTAPTWSAL
jgi:putative NIF3 family GTP cyclohydrolase 1 type 2